MTITNGYATLADVKERLLDQYTYTASTLSFTASTKTIADTDYGLKRFEDIDNITKLIKITGTTTNAGVYTLSTVAAASIVVTDTLTDEVAGTAVTIQAYGLHENDPALESIITTVSRWIDSYCWRRFYAATETRYYDSGDPDSLDVDDILSITTLKTDEDGDRTYETTWATTDYDLMPYNASVDGKPYTSIQTSDDGTEDFPVEVKKCIQVYGSFGYTATTPDMIKEACILQSIRLFKRKDSPFGVSGVSELGILQIVPKLDVDVKQLLDGYRRLV